MARSTADYSIDVSKVSGVCAAGEAYAAQQIAARKTPVLACEGPCIRGEIARLAANKVGKEAPYARCCYAEAFLVPHSSMTSWLKEAEKVIVIDGCFLKCIGRVAENVVDKEKLINIDAYPLYKEHSDKFLYTDVPEESRNELAHQVADKVLKMLGQDQVAAA